MFNFHWQFFFLWTFHYPYFPFSLRTTIPMFFLYFMTPPKLNHKLYPLLIKKKFTLRNTHIWFMEFLIIKFSCCSLLVNFLPHLIHASWIYNMQKLFLPPFNLVLAELGLRRLRVPFSFPCHSLPHLLIVPIITHITRFIKYKYIIYFPPIQSSHGRPLMSLGYWFFFGNYLHDFMFKTTYSNLINLILINSAIPPISLKNLNLQIIKLMHNS